MTVLLVVVDQNGNGIQGALVSWEYGSVQSGLNGVTTLNLGTTPINQTIVFNILAAGYSKNSLTITTTQATSTYNVAMTPSPATFALTITFTDVSSHPIAGATVFLNGSSLGTTDVQGNILVPLLSGANSLQVTAANFQPYSTSLVGGDGSAPDTIVLTPTAAAGVPITLVISPAGASYQIGSTIGTIGSDGTGKTQDSFVPGTYSIIWTYNNGQTRTDPLVVVAGQTVYTFPPLPVTDAGALTGTSSQGLQDIANSSIITPGPSTPSYEFLYPNSNFGKYFTATQARMYIGNLFIDELAGFQFTLQENRVPIFGYCSRKMDAIGTGKGLVQGQFMINFISEGYLFTVLNEYATWYTSTPSTDEQSFIKLLNIQKGLQSQIPSATTAQQLNLIQQQKMQMLAHNPSLAAAYKQSQQTASLPPEYNAVYQKVPFDIELQMEGGGRTVTRWIRKCSLISNEQVFGDSDSTTMDCYGFMARSLQ